MSAVEHGFKAEVQQLLELMIHSVYSDREVFVRELVSNAADALDKVKFLELTRSDLVPAGNETHGIRVSHDKDARTVVFEDDGIGMTETEVVDHLGTIAKSGTREFLAQAGEGQGPKLIGQFGLGFYSAFMVADRVTVDTRSAMPDSRPVRWESGGKGTFDVSESDREARGTRITLHLREDAGEFLDAVRLKGAVRKHSNFLPWPIAVEGEQANTAQALWAEPPGNVTDEQAAAFYRTVATDWQDPARRIHVSVDSPIQYSALLFVPRDRPWDLFHPDAAKGPKLYARRVLIDDHAKEILPDWLRFVRGVVDSEDIALNVSREMVQKTPIVRKIREALSKRILKELGEWGDEPAPAEGAQDAATYAGFWHNFGVLLKEGHVHEHHKWGELLVPLLRFNALSHAGDDDLLSLADYRKSMPPAQDAIWVLTGESRSALLASPHLEVFRKKGWDVLLLTDAVDEWLVNTLTTYDGLPIKSVSRGAIDLGETDDAAEKADLTEFTAWLARLLEDRIVDVRPSARLTESAVVLVDAEDALSANMERILKQAHQDVGRRARRVLEINPTHPLIRNLEGLRKKGRETEASELAELLYDDALLLEGTVAEPAALGRRLQRFLQHASERALG
jgi:molecular chaperone HtpG